MITALTVAHAESIEYVVTMLDHVAPRSGGADNRALAQEAAQIIRRVCVSDEEMVQHVARALAAYFGESLEDLHEGDQSSYTAQARHVLGVIEERKKSPDKLKGAAERAVQWFGMFAAEPEDYTVMHELQEALGQTVEHHGCRCE
jgi:hypothetical protein